MCVRRGIIAINRELFFIGGVRQSNTPEHHPKETAVIDVEASGQNRHGRKQGMTRYRATSRGPSPKIFFSFLPDVFSWFRNRKNRKYEKNAYLNENFEKFKNSNSGIVSPRHATSPYCTKSTYFISSMFHHHHHHMCVAVSSYKS